MISTRPILTTPLAIDLNDAAVAVVSETGLLHVEPAYVVVAEGPARFGADALPVLKRWPRLTSVRYWRDLTAAPPATAAARLYIECRDRRCASAPAVADTWRQQPAADWSAPRRPGGRPNRSAPLIDITGEYEVAILGLVDASVAAVRNEYPGRELLNIDAGLHTLTLTHIRQGGQASVGEREFFPSLGIESLQRLATELIARRFIEHSRFDPLHSAEMEQALFDRLPDWLGRVARDVDARLELKSGTRQVPGHHRRGGFQGAHGRGLRAAVAAAAVPDRDAWSACAAGAAAADRFPRRAREPDAAAGVRDPCAGTRRSRIRCARPAHARAGGCARGAHRVALGSTAGRKEPRPQWRRRDAASVPQPICWPDIVPGVSAQSP